MGNYSRRRNLHPAVSGLIALGNNDRQTKHALCQPPVTSPPISSFALADMRRSHGRPDAGPSRHPATVFNCFFFFFPFPPLVRLFLPSLNLHPRLPRLLSRLPLLSLSHAGSSEVQVLLHETPAVALIEGRYGGTKTTGGRACPLSLQLSTGLTFGNCKLQKLARAKCLTLFDLQPYGVGREERRAPK